MITATRPTFTADQLTKDQLLDLRNTIASENDHSYDYLIQEITASVRHHAHWLLNDQGIHVDVEDDAVDELTDQLMDLVNLRLTIDGLDPQRAA